jgi:hypothetical protein
VQSLVIEHWSRLFEHVTKSLENWVEDTTRDTAASQQFKDVFAVFAEIPILYFPPDANAKRSVSENRLLMWKRPFRATSHVLALVEYIITQEELETLKGFSLCGLTLKDWSFRTQWLRFCRVSRCCFPGSIFLWTNIPKV